MRYVIWFCAVAISFVLGWSGVRWLSWHRPSLPLLVQPAQQPVSHQPTRAIPNPAPPTTPVTYEAEADSLAELLEQPSGVARDHALFTAIRSWEAADFPKGADEMLALIKQHGNGIGSEGEHITEAWLDRWLEIDAPAALKYLEESKFLTEIPALRSRTSLTQSPLGGAFRALLRHRPAWVRDMVVQMEPGTPRNIAAPVLIALAARGGIAQAQPYLADFPQFREDALIGYVNAAASSDPIAALDAVLAEPPGNSRETLLTEIFAAAGARDLDAGRGMLDRIEDPAMRTRLAGSLLSSAKNSDPEATLNFVREEAEKLAAAGKRGLEAIAWVRSAQYGLPTETLQAIAEWSAEFKADPDRELFVQIARDWGSRDGPKMRAWLSTNGSLLDSAAIGKLSYALNDMAESGLPAMKEWIATLPEGALRNQAQFQVALQTTAQGDLAAAQTAYRSLADLDTSGALAGQLASTLLKSDPAAAGDWALRHTAGEARNVALRTIAEQWSMSDPQGAGHWVAQVPAGSDRDIVVQKYATNAMLADPSAAAEWALQIGDSKIREDTMSSVMHAWQIWDPVAARAWYRQAPGLGAAAHQKLLRTAQ